MTLQHASLEVRAADAAREVEFWALLGFTEVDPPTALREHSRWVQAGETQIHVMYVDDPAVPPSGHVAVICADYEATLSRLSADGLDVQERTPHWDAPRCFVTSPAGHRVEVMAAPPA